MNNHARFIVLPNAQNDLAIAFKTARVRYARYVNRQRKTKGHLWQGRFYPCVFDEAHSYREIRYVENNPARAKITNTAWNCEYSSAKDHAGKNKPLITLVAYEGIKKENLGRNTYKKMIL